MDERESQIYIAVYAAAISNGKTNKEANDIAYQSLWDLKHSSMKWYDT